MIHYDSAVLITKNVEGMKRFYMDVLRHDIEEEAWGQRTIRFFDPDGNLIELGESIPCFCRRLYGGGMTAEQVADKTGAHIDKVKEYVGG